jgi:hypothetical protein
VLFIFLLLLDPAFGCRSHFAYGRPGWSVARRMITLALANIGQRQCA